MLTSLVLAMGLVAAVAAEEQPPAPIQNLPHAAAPQAESVPAGKYYAQGAEGVPGPVHIGALGYNDDFAAKSCSCTNFDYNQRGDYCGGNPYCGCCNPRGDCGGYAGYAPSRWTSAPGGGYSLAGCDGDPRGHCDHCGPYKSCCNMSLHHAYYPQANGYYYFRPYNYTAICQQRQVITAWGGDRRNPYDTRFVFDKVYSDLEAEGLIAPDRPVDENETGVLGPMTAPPKVRPIAPPPGIESPMPAPPAPKNAAGPSDLNGGASTRPARSVVQVVFERP